MTKLYTDTSANLPLALLREYDIAVIPFSYTVNGVAEDYSEETDFDGKAFYDAMRRGAEVKTSMVNPATAAAFFERALAQGNDVLYVGMSGGISGTAHAAALAAEELREKYPHAKIMTIDTYAASLGEGLQVLEAAELLRARIREELGLAYSVYTYSSSYQGLGSFCVYAGTTPDNAPTVLSELQSQLDLLLRDGLTDKEFRSAKAQLRGGFLLGLESSGGRMQALGRGHLLMGHVRTPEETLSRIEAVTPDAVMELARRLLGQKGSAAIVGRGAEALLARIGG